MTHTLEPHRTIYLQWNHEHDTDEGVTWCVDKIDNSDIRYIRADAHDALVAACEAALLDLDEYAELRDTNCEAIGCECHMNREFSPCSDDIKDTIVKVRDILKLTQETTT